MIKLIYKGTEPIYLKFWKKKKKSVSTRVSGKWAYCACSVGTFGDTCTDGFSGLQRE